MQRIHDKSSERKCMKRGAHALVALQFDRIGHAFTRIELGIYDLPLMQNSLYALSRKVHGEDSIKTKSADGQLFCRLIR